MDISRRALLRAGAAAGAGLLLPTRFATTAAGVVPAGALPFTEQLPTLSDLGLLDMTNGGTQALDVVNATHRFFGSAAGAADTLAYQVPGGAQSYLGPVIVAKQGVPFELVVRNKLTTHPLGSAVDDELVPDDADDEDWPRISTHLHGGNTAPGSDGGPLDVFHPETSPQAAAGEKTSWTYSYGNTQEAAGLWYHDHALGITRLNVYAGLASGYLIRDDHDDPGDGSVLPAPPYEVPLVIQDRMFKGDGTLDYPPNPNGRPWAPEFFGDVSTVNGKAWPNLNVVQGKYRFRVYNGSNARFYNLKLNDPSGRALAFVQIGSDGGLLNTPVKMNKLVLGPGERADLVVDFAGLGIGQTITMTNNAPTPFPDGPVAPAVGGMPLRQVMRFTVVSTPVGESPWTAPLPKKLRSTPVTRLADYVTATTVKRNMTLVEIMDPVQGPVMALLNNRMLHATDYESAPVQKNALEQWELINLTGDAHPIHLHFTQFQVLDRQRIDAGAYQAVTYGPGMLMEGAGDYAPPAINPPVDAFLIGRPAPPPANEQGWKDTVVAMPGQVTRILVPFGAEAAGGAPLAFSSSFTGDYVWHCHILEHEDNDMMQMFRIE